jgi:hypothetical protein
MTPGHTTSTGIVIGRAYVPPPQRVQGDAIQIQRALLAKEKRFAVDYAVWAALAVGAVAVAISIFCQGAP